jgi:protein TonB
MLGRLLRYVAAAGLAGAVTFGLLWTMQMLVVGQRPDIKDAKAGRMVEFVRLRRESAPEPKKRELPKRAAPQAPPPPPDMQVSNVPQENAMEIAAAMPEFEADLDIGKGPGDGAAGAAANDTDVVPLVRVNPQYPARAMQRGIEGWVHLEFTITEAGTTKDVEVIEAEPVNVFEDAALAAVRKYKYKPKVEQGRAIERPGVAVMLSFKLNK